MTAFPNVQVSVITPAFNCERFIERALQSVSRQSGDLHIEHIIIDDCSIDSTCAILEEYGRQDPLVKIIRLPRNSGPAEARNVGVRRASGRFLAFLDADDIWLPDKCSIQVEFMQKTGAAVSFTDYRFISDDGHRIGRRLRGPQRVGWHLHHMTRYLGCLTVMVDRSKVPDFHFPKVPPLYKAEDFLAWAPIVAREPAVRVPVDLARYAVVPNSRSSSTWLNGTSVWEVYRKIEKIPLSLAAFYFCSYAAFALAKRRYCRPLWERSRIDKGWKSDVEQPVFARAEGTE